MEKGGFWRGSEFLQMVLNWYREKDAKDLVSVAAVLLVLLFLTVEVFLPMGRTGAQALVMVGVTVFVLAALPWE